MNNSANGTDTDRCQLPIAPSGQSCPRCGMPALTFQWRRFSNDRSHIEVRCQCCHRFVKWAALTDFNSHLANWTEMQLQIAEGQG